MEEPKLSKRIEKLINMLKEMKTINEENTEKLKIVLNEWYYEIKKLEGETE